MSASWALALISLPDPNPEQLLSLSTRTTQETKELMALQSKEEEKKDDDEDF